MSDVERADVVVVGGGAMGCSIAYHLASRGVRPLLLEQHRIGAPPSASGASAAMITVLADHDPAVTAQSQLSRRLLRELAPQLRERTGIDIDFQRLGSIRLAFTEQDAAELRDRARARHAALNETTEWLDTKAVLEAEPAAPEAVLGGLYVPSAENVYAPKYVRALAAAAASFSQWLGAPLTIVPQRGQIMALAPQPGQPRVSRLLLTPFGYVAPKPNGTAVVGATHEFVGFDARVTASGVRYLTDLAQRLAPGLAAATLKHTWAGFRPMVTEGDGLPTVGRLPGLDNAYVAAGHGAIGINLAAAVGHQMAQLIRGEAPDLSLAPFDPARPMA